MPAYRVRVSLDLAGIRASFARERPPVEDDDWDQEAYVRERIAAYREALGALCSADPPWAIEACFDTEAADGDRFTLAPTEPAADGIPAPLAQSIEQALQRVRADASAWRRHLRAGYFERHRAWRRETGSPIAH